MPALESGTKDALTYSVYHEERRQNALAQDSILSCYKFILSFANQFLPLHGYLMENDFFFISVVLLNHCSPTQIPYLHFNLLIVNKCQPWNGNKRESHAHSMFLLLFFIKDVSNSSRQMKPVKEDFQTTANSDCEHYQLESIFRYTGLQ